RARPRLVATPPAPSAVLPLSLHDALPISDRFAVGEVRVHHLGKQRVGPEHAQQVVLEAQIELAEAGVALTARAAAQLVVDTPALDRKSTRLNSSHVKISYAVFCLKKKKKT